MTQSKPLSPLPLSDEAKCDCGHRRERHYHKRGMCEATAVNGHICSCSRFKLPKLPVGTEGEK